MALFKIFKGLSSNLGADSEAKTVATHEGYAYFTPDDGKFYIDITNDEDPVIGNYQNEISEDGRPANRICINQKIFSYKDTDILDCGTAEENMGGDPTIKEIIFNCGDSSTI